MAVGDAWWETVAAVAPRNAPWSGRYAGPFESDEADDELAEIAEADDPQEALTEFLRGFDPAEAYLASDDVDGVVAVACLVAARLSGQVLDEAAEGALEEIPFVVTEELRGLAAGVLDRVVRPGGNEYHSWYENDPEGLADWLGQLAWYRVLLEK
jgi:hypothetical protein